MYTTTWYIAIQKYVIKHNIKSNNDFKDKRYCDGSMQSYIEKVYKELPTDVQEDIVIPPYRP